MPEQTFASRWFSTTVNMCTFWTPRPPQSLYIHHHHHHHHKQNPRHHNDNNAQDGEQSAGGADLRHTMLRQAQTGLL